MLRGDRVRRAGRAAPAARRRSSRSSSWSAFLLTNKVWSPQYSLWLVPLAVLADPALAAAAGWMLIDALVWVPRMFYYLGVDHKGLPEGWFLGTVVLRDLAVARAVRAGGPRDLPPAAPTWCGPPATTTRRAASSTAPAT